jgi:hypothetical protein
MSDIERLTDAELVAAYLAGDRGAFAGIYDRYADRIFSHHLTMLGERADAADATHNVFMEASRRMDQMESPEELWPWLFAISRNEAQSRGDPGGVTPEEDMSEALTDGPDLAVVPAPIALRPRVLDKVDRGPGASSTIPSRPTPEWMKLGVFAVVALIVGLIGFAVSAQVERLEPLPAVPVVEGPPLADDSTTTTSTSSTQPGSTSTTAAASTTTTAPGAPAALEVSTDTVDLGGDATGGAFDLANTGGRPDEWTLVSSSDAIAVSAGSGEIGGGETVTIDVSLNRDEIEEGEISETLTITWSGGEIPISVVGSHEANPIIHNPQASPPSLEVAGSPECPNDQTTITARVRDASPLDSVVVRWSADGGGETETPMEAVGNDMFEAVIGPFTAVRTATVRIVAFDDRGNAGGATTQVAVVACP